MPGRSAWHLSWQSWCWAPPGLEYDEFFAFAYPDLRPPDQESEAARRIQAMLEDLRPFGSRVERPAPPAEKAPPPAEPLSRDELLADFKKMLRELMSENRPGDDPKKGNGNKGEE